MNKTKDKKKATKAQKKMSCLNCGNDMTAHLSNELERQKKEIIEEFVKEAKKIVDRVAESEGSGFGMWEELDKLKTKQLKQLKK